MEPLAVPEVEAALAVGPRQVALALARRVVVIAAVDPNLTFH